MTKKTATHQEVDTTLNAYELMLILNPDLRETDIKKKLKEIEEMITKAGGKITHEDFWGKRELAFRIKKQTEGVYMIYNFELQGSFLPELKEHLRIEKEMLRSMIIKLPNGYTYTKYDLTVEEKPRREKESPKKNISIKHNAPIIHARKKEEKITLDSEAQARREEKPVSEESESKKKLELDKKLDEILGGEDLKL